MPNVTRGENRGVTVGGSGGFKNYARDSNVLNLRFTTYSASTTGREQKFTSYSKNGNADYQSFSNYGHDALGAVNGFNSYGTESNVVGSGFSSYAEKGMSASTISVASKIDNVLFILCFLSVYNNIVREKSRRYFTKL